MKASKSNAVAGPLRAVEKNDLSGLAGMIKAPSRGLPRRLETFDAASLLVRPSPRRR